MSNKVTKSPKKFVSKHCLGVTDCTACFPFIHPFFGLKFLGRKYFTAQDIRLIENYFSTNILMRRCPNKSEVDGFLNKHPIRSPKDWLKIKFCVRNIYVVSTIFVLRCVIVKCEVVVAYPSQCWFFPSHAFSLGKTYFAVDGGPQKGLKTALRIF